MNTAQRTDAIRVEKGQASEEELAALTAVLLARAAHRPAAATPAGPHATAARWRRLERQNGFHGATSWQR
ncbi:acyl-CoA carboxylase epsilon subunit-like protein [Streptomyces sp. 2333.5]|uniref:acyl-CoA carboxylase epsilon subunit n=1 Tax=Streptomyces TaxID=1883 RepID=UPI00089B14CE|nr:MULTISPECIES: acyl-CoA carboxylase epsilon subunit [unclassified Streptomyces]PJJ04687.1 acyl-CoA carboxylase epsilon subunit-like protein [Streptomyces sp. 2333.5]SEE57857.1 Acyl-CoA carboxylase epsilon subunit [Streptomyces sp. 2314.4]SEE85018.1 Acyl-CoA carboxylase epsilon subunit [Streptomyces sp. 2112.2]SOE10945.1 Acyl-CoA carboxylase epsilon subunit [Streptomyces sp. 2323.1]